VPRPSLFVVSLPRSLSTLLYHAVRRPLALREPEWTTDGEILNLRRFALLAEEGEIEGVRYLEADRDPPRFDRLLSFLDQVVQPAGFAYKDVIQPFVLGAWLAARRTPVLFVDRPVADVAGALLDRGWLYPALAARGEAALPPAARDAVGVHTADLSALLAPHEIERALVAGLLAARHVLAACATQTLAYDDVIHDEEPLAAALASLYGEPVAPPRYLDENFCQQRDEALRRRSSARHGRLAALAAELSTAARA
jgi:hypothetical protein